MRNVQCAMANGIRIPVGTVVKILGKDRVRLLMSYNIPPPNFVTGNSWDTRKHHNAWAGLLARVVYSRLFSDWAPDRPGHK